MLVITSFSIYIILLESFNSKTIYGITYNFPNHVQMSSHWIINSSANFYANQRLIGRITQTTDSLIRWLVSIDNQAVQ